MRSGAPVAIHGPYRVRAIEKRPQPWPGPFRQPHSVHIAYIDALRAEFGEDGLVAAAATDEERRTVEAAMTEIPAPVTTIPAHVHAMSTTMPAHAMGRSGGRSDSGN